MPTSVALYPHFTTTRTATDIRTVEELLGTRCGDDGHLFACNEKKPVLNVEESGGFDQKCLIADLGHEVVFWFVDRILVTIQTSSETV